MTNEFQRSNSTTNAFIGGTQKDWMTGQLPKSTRDPSSPKASMPKATDQVGKFSHRAESAPDVYKAVERKDLPNTAFGPNFDRGRYPAQRPRQESTNKHARRLTASTVASSAPPVSSPPVVEESSYTLPAVPVVVSTNAKNVLPSPSPSVEARQNSVNAIEIEDEDHQPQAAELQPVETPTAALEELVIRFGGIEQVEKLLKDADKSNYGPSQIAASAVAQELPGAISLSGPQPPRQPPVSSSQLRSESDHGAQVPSIGNKRTQEITDEPRKRLQSIPGSSFGNPVALPSATTVLPNQNGQGSPAASPSGNEMHRFAQDLAQRIQLVANIPNRKGDQVERPRLELLREACESSDYFYLILHQLFCFDYRTRKSNRRVPSLNDMHRKGLDVVAFLLVSNDDMADDAVAWFAFFPLSWGKLQSTSAYAKALRCLEKMATFWDQLRSQCRKRKCPPLVDELVVLFNVESFLFQQIIFRAVLRDIWSGKPDNCSCFSIVEGLFNRDYKAVMDRLSVGSTTFGLAEFYQQAIIKEYQQIFGSHWQHTVAGATANMAAPLQQQSQSRLAPANSGSNRRNKSQHGHNKSTQSPLTLDLHAAQRHNLSVASGPAPIAVQDMQICRQGNLLSQSQALASNPLPSPHIGNFTQSPTTLQGIFSPGYSMNPPWQSNNQQQQRERRTSSTSGTIRNVPESTTPTQPISHVVPSNVLGNAHMHQFQQTIGSQQQSHNSTLSLNSINPRSHSQPEVRRALSNQAGETTLPTLVPHPLVHSSHSHPALTNPTSFIRSYPPLPTHPNPTTSALHQAHLRSPTLSCLDPSKASSSMTKCYRFIKHILMPPAELDSKNRHVNWEFNVNKELTDLFAPDALTCHGAPPARAIVPGSRLCRIRCINLKAKSGMPTQSEWAVADNVWPGSTAVILNGIALDIRKKTHHGKDLPIDVTRYIKAGQNNLSTAVIGFEKDSISRYVIGVEFIQVVDEQQIKNEIKIFPYLEARKRILDQSKKVDPDIEFIQSQRVLDLTDPFTARIFEVPVRGINCNHNQCFDRDTFLETRTAKVPGEPCGPDEFRCPICGQDARPQSLMIDTFFLSVRKALEERDRLDAKAIILHDSGQWQVKEEEEASGESGDGTGRRSAGLAGARTASASAARQSTPREVIEIDDD